MTEPRPTRALLPVFRLALTTMLLLWLSFPPMGASFLAWVAPAPLLITCFATKLPSRAYRRLYLAGLCYWAATFYFIPIPHPALWGCWIAITLYMAIYTPLLVWVARWLIHQAAIHPLIAIPIVWTGIEYLRCHFATGMPMVCLSHSQYQHPVIIQMADLSGAYGLTWLIASVATAVSILLAPIMLKGEAKAKFESRPALIGAAILMLLAFNLGYGLYRIKQYEEPSDADQLGVGLVQTSQDVQFKPMTLEEAESKLKQLTELTRNVIWKDEFGVSVIVWPENALPGLAVDLMSDSGSFTRQQSRADLKQLMSHIWQSSQSILGIDKKMDLPELPPVISGIGSTDPANDSTYNAAVLIKNGEITQRYYKRHLVMFGEYVPFADQVPMIQSFSPMNRNMNAGTEFEVFEVNGFYLAPSICFETTVPHLVRQQVVELQQRGKAPDAIVNLTNDGWFFGTSCLDLHLACNVFRAVENRVQVLVAANTGLSVHIDARGSIESVGPRRKTAALHCMITPASERPILYHRIGDWMPWTMGVIVLLGGFGAFISSSRFRRKRD